MTELPEPVQEILDIEEGPECEECGDSVEDHVRDPHGDIVCDDCQEKHPEWYVDEVEGP